MKFVDIDDDDTNAVIITITNNTLTTWTYLWCCQQETLPEFSWFV